MGYFPNGSSGASYRDKFCDNCVHDKDANCPIWNLHLERNYEECNDKNSALHVLIPRDENGGNKKCTMFLPL